jgi:hypothetical protein
MIRLLTLFAAAALISGCATAPPPSLTADSPASPNAAAGVPPGRHSSLRPDEATLKSRAILSAAAKAQKQWDEEGPVSGTPAAPGAPTKPDTMPGMDHSKMKGMTP